MNYEANLYDVIKMSVNFKVLKVHDLIRIIRNTYDCLESLINHKITIYDKVCITTEFLKSFFSIIVVISEACYIKFVTS